jgi:hypothetical protein
VVLVRSVTTKGALLGPLIAAELGRNSPSDLVRARLAIGPPSPASYRDRRPSKAHIAKAIMTITNKISLLPVLSATRTANVSLAAAQISRKTAPRQDTRAKATSNSAGKVDENTRNGKVVISKSNPVRPRKTRAVHTSFNSRSRRDTAAPTETPESPSAPYPKSTHEYRVCLRRY